MAARTGNDSGSGQRPAAVQNPTTSSKSSLVPPLTDIMELSIQMYTAYNSKTDAWTFLDEKLLPFINNYLRNQAGDEVGIRLVRLSRQFGIPPDSALKLIRNLTEIAPANLTSKCSPRLKMVCEAIYRGMETHGRNEPEDCTNGKWINVVSELVKCIQHYNNNEVIQLVSTLSSVFKLLRDTESVRKFRNQVLEMPHLGTEAREILLRDIAAENRIKNRKPDEHIFYKDGILTNCKRVGQTYLTINQTRMTMTMSTTNFESERESFRIVNIKQTLEREMASQSNIRTAEGKPIYGGTVYDGTNLSYFKGTHAEIDMLLQDAKEGRPLRDEDLQEYLPKRFMGNHFTKGFPLPIFPTCGSHSECNKKIAEIFWLASSSPHKKYVLRKPALKELFKRVDAGNNKLILLPLKAIKAQCSIAGNLVFEDFQQRYHTVRNFYETQKHLENSPREDTRECLALAKSLMDEEFKQHGSEDKLIVSLEYDLKFLSKDKSLISEQEAVNIAQNVIQLIQSSPEIFTDQLLGKIRNFVAGKTDSKSRIRSFFTEIRTTNTYYNPVTKIYEDMMSDGGVNENPSIFKAFANLFEPSRIHPQVRIESVKIIKSILINCQKSRKEWNETIETALEILKEPEPTESLSTEHREKFFVQNLCLIYSAFEFQPEIAVPMIPVLFDLLKTLSGEPLYILVAVLASRIHDQTTVFNIHVQDNLFEMLTEDIPIAVSEHGEFSIAPITTNNEETRTEMLSNYASSIVLYAARHGTVQYSWNSCRTLLVDSVTSSESKQFRINIAESIYTKREQIFTAMNTHEVPKIFDILGKLSGDEVPDCQVFGRATLVFFVETATKQFPTHLDSELLKSFLQTSATIFCDNEFTLGEKSFQEEINNSILATFLELAQRQVPFPPEVFTLFNAILQAGEMYVNDVIQILSRYVKNDQLPSPILPSTTIAAVESVTSAQPENTMPCLEILTPCILAGQNVSFKVIESLKDLLYDDKVDSTTRDKYFTAFTKAMEVNLLVGESIGQELLDILEMENISREALNNLNEQHGKFNYRLQLSSASFLLNKIAANSRELTIKNYEWMDEMLNFDLTNVSNLTNNTKEIVLETQEKILEMLILATENNQEVPEALIEKTIVDKLWSPKKPQMNPILLLKTCQLFTVRLKNNKSSIPTLPRKLELVLMNQNSPLDDPLYFEVCLLFFNIGNLPEPIEESIFLQTISKFSAAVSEERIQNHMLETMFLLCSHLPNSETLNTEVHSLALDIFLKTNFYQLGLKLVNSLPKIGEDLTNAIIRKTGQCAANFTQQVVDLLKRHSISDEKLQKKIAALSEKLTPENLLSAIQGELDKPVVNLGSLYKFAHQLPFILEHHSNTSKVALLLIKLLDRYEQKFVHDKEEGEGMVCNINFWSSLMEMVINSIDSHNEEKANALIMVVEDVIEKCSKIIQGARHSRKVLIKDSYVTTLLAVLQKFEATSRRTEEAGNEQDNLNLNEINRIKKVFRLIKDSSIVSEISLKLVRIESLEISVEEKADTFEKTIEELKTATEEVIVNFLPKFDEILDKTNDYTSLASLNNISSETGSKIYNYARLLSLFVTRGLSRQVCGKAIWIRFVKFMTKYATFVINDGLNSKELCGIPSEVLTAIGTIFQMSAEDDGVDLSNLASLLELISSQLEFSNTSSKTSENGVIVIQISSICVKHYNQDNNIEMVNSKKISMLRNLYKNNSNNKLIRYYSFSGLYAAYQKIPALKTTVLSDLVKSFPSKIGSVPISPTDISDKHKMELFRSSILVSKEALEYFKNSLPNYKNPLRLRTHLLSSELLKILTNKDHLVQTCNISEVIHQINSKVAYRPLDETKRIGSIYENIIVLITPSLKKEEEISSLPSEIVAEVSETLTYLYYVSPEYLQKEHVLVDGITSLKNKLKIEAVRRILQDKLQTDDDDTNQEEEKLKIVLRLSRTMSQNHGNKIAMALEMLNSVTKFTEKELDDLDEIMEFLGKKNIQVKLFNNVHYDTLLTCSREIFTTAIMKNPKFQELARVHKNRLEKAVQFILQRKSFEDTSFFINLAFDRNQLFPDPHWTDFFQVLAQFSDSLLDQEWDNIIKFIDNEKSSKWLKGINHILVEALFRPNESNMLNLEQVVENFVFQNTKYRANKEDLHFKIAQIQNHATTNLTKGDFSKHLESIQDKLFQRPQTSHNQENALSPEEELISLLIVASKQVYGYDLTDNQILSLFLATENREKTGLLQQIETGGGKSPIIRLTAVLKCLLHKKPILVATSNLDLARRDARECRKLASLFSLTVDYNADKREYIAGKKNCYKCDIIYIEPSQMAFDILRHEYSQLNTLGDFKPEIILVDEVDSMLIDDSYKSARLTSEIPGMEFLQPIYHLLWNRLHVLLQRIIFVEKDGIQRKYFVKEKFREKFDNIQNLEKEIESSDNPNTLEEYCDLISDRNEESIVELLCDELQSFLKENISLSSAESTETDSPKLYVPKHLEGFVQSQIKRWPLSLLTALSYIDNIHYIDKDGLIQPVEFDTSGVIRMNQNWSDGIHQFLQIKHNVPFVPESLPTNFLSNIGFFKRFQPKNIFGYTGTCGSYASKEFLTKCNYLEILEIPSRYASKKLHKYPDLEFGDNCNWTSSIIDSVKLECKKERATLVVCRTIREAKSIYKQLKEVLPENKVKLYARNSEHEERKIQRIDSGEVIVATLIAGRGTDIKTSRNVEANGGLHLIATFIPQNQRAEDQILGRTARMGKCGTAQFILFNHHDSTSNLCKSLREQRDESERIMLQEFGKKSLPLIELKDELFKEFCTSLTNVRELIKKDILVKDKIKKCFGIPIPSAFERGVVSCFEEEWAYFVREMESTTDISHESRQCLKDKFKEIQTIFVSKLEESLKEKDEEKAIIFQYSEPITKTVRKAKIISNPYHAIQVGNELAKKENFKAAEVYFERAIGIEPKLSSAAYQGLGWCSLEDKVKSMKCLKEALKCFAEEKGILELCYQPEADKSERTLQAQIICTIDLIGNHINSVHTDLNTIKKSERFVDICRQNPHTGNQIEHIEVQREEKNVKQDPSFTSYDVTFHDLSVENGDLKKQNDQLIRVADAFKDCKRELVLPLANTSMLYSLTEETIDKRGLTKENALSLLQDSWKDKVVNKFKELVKKETPPEDIVACTIRSQEGQFEILRDTSRDNVMSQIKKASTDCLIDLSIRNRGVRTLIENQRFNVTLLGVSYNKISRILSHARPENGSPECSLRASGTPNDLEAFLSACDGLKVNLFFVAEDSPSIVQRNSFEVTGNSKPSNWKNVKTIQVPIQHETLTMQENCTKNLLLDLCVSSVNSYQLKEILKLHGNKLADVFMPIQKEEISPFHQIVEMFREANFELDLKISDLTYDKARAAIQSKEIKSEVIEAKGMKNVIDCYSKGHIPQPLYLLVGRGLEFYLCLNEKLFVPWLSVCTVASLSALQIAVGSALCLTGVGATIGAGLITEGCADAIYTYRVYSTRGFNWKAYSIQKTLSVGISLTTMGLGAFKYLGNVGTEAVEQGAVQVLMNGKTLGTFSKDAIGSMAKLVGKKVGVGIAEATAREVVFTATARGSSMLMNHLEDGIKDSLTRSLGYRAVQIKHNERFSLLTCLNRLEVMCQTFPQRYSLSDKVDSILVEITNPTSSGWSETLIQAGTMIGQKVAGSLSGGGSSSNLNALTYTSLVFSAVKGLAEINNLCDQICSQITQKLTEYEIENFNFGSAVRLITLEDESEALASIIESKLHRNGCGCRSPLLFYDLVKNHLNFEEEIKNIHLSAMELHRLRIRSQNELVNPMKKIAEGIKKLKGSLEKETELPLYLEARHSRIAKQIVDSLSEQLTQTVQSKMMNPALTIAGSALVNVASEYLQERFLLNISQSSPDQQKNERKYQSCHEKILQGKELTAEDKLFFESYRKIRTVDDQIRGQQEFSMKLRSMETIAKTLQLNRKDDIEECSSEEAVTAERYVECIKNGQKKGSLCEMKHLLEKYNVPEGVLIDNQSSSEMRDSQAGYVVEWSVTRGDQSFTLYKDGKVVQENMRCGFEVVERLTSVKQERLRKEMWEDVLANKKVMVSKVRAEDVVLRLSGHSGHGRFLDGSNLGTAKTWGATVMSGLTSVKGKFNNETFKKLMSGLVNGGKGSRSQDGREAAAEEVPRTASPSSSGGNATTSESSSNTRFVTNLAKCFAVCFVAYLFMAYLFPEVNLVVAVLMILFTLCFWYLSRPEK